MFLVERIHMPTFANDGYLLVDASTNDRVSNPPASWSKEALINFINANKSIKYELYIYGIYNKIHPKYLQEKSKWFVLWQSKEITAKSTSEFIKKYKELKDKSILELKREAPVIEKNFDFHSFIYIPYITNYEAQTANYLAPFIEVVVLKDLMKPKVFINGPNKNINEIDKNVAALDKFADAVKFNMAIPKAADPFVDF